MKGYVHISSCHGNVIHVSIGAITVRLDSESFLILTAEMQNFAAKLPGPQTERPTLRAVPVPTDA